MVYVIELPGNRYIIAGTHFGGDYKQSRQVLADMMRTLEVIER